MTIEPDKVFFFARSQILFLEVFAFPTELMVYKLGI